MPLYFFDVQDGRFERDDEGTECADFASARTQAMALLPEIARWAIPKGNDKQVFIVMVRDDTGVIVYSATLMFAGLTLTDGINI